MNLQAYGLRQQGRIAGLLYLLVVLSGMFCLAYVPSITGLTLAGAAAHAGLFRAGIAGFLLMQVAFLLLPLALYRVLADVDRSAAAAMVALAVVSVPIGLVAVTHRLDVLPMLQADITPAAETAYASALRQYGHGLRIASLFWGLWLLPFGWLVVRSARLPRVLGVLLVLGGAGYVLQVFGGLLPSIANAGWLGYLRMPAAFGEIGSCLWLLLFGARAGRASED